MQIEATCGNQFGIWLKVLEKPPMPGARRYRKALCRVLTDGRSQHQRNEHLKRLDGGRLAASRIYCGHNDWGKALNRQRG